MGASPMLITTMTEGFFTRLRQDANIRMVWFICKGRMHTYKSDLSIQEYEVGA